MSGRAVSGHGPPAPPALAARSRGWQLGMGNDKVGLRHAPLAEADDVEVEGARSPALAADPPVGFARWPGRRASSARGASAVSSSTIWLRYGGCSMPPSGAVSSIGRGGHQPGVRQGAEGGARRRRWPRGRPGCCRARRRPALGAGVRSHARRRSGARSAADRTRRRRARGWPARARPAPRAASRPRGAPALGLARVRAAPTSPPARSAPVKRVHRRRCCAAVSAMRLGVPARLAGGARRSHRAPGGVGAQLLHAAPRSPARAPSGSETLSTWLAISLEQLARLPRGVQALRGEVAHLVGHDGEAPPFPAGPGRFDRGVERDEIGRDRRSRGWCR